MSGHRHLPVLALIPAAGRASRLGELPSSKEILTVGEVLDPETGARRPQAAIEHLLASLRLAGIDEGFLVLRPEKRDIPEYLAARGDLGIDLTCLELDESPSVPHTLDRAYRQLRDRRTALGFPDILFRPTDAYAGVLTLQEETGADLALGLFPTGQPSKADMVDLDESGRVRGLIIKREDTGLRYTWSVAVWGPSFTELLHRFVGELDGQGRVGGLGREAYVGDVVSRALEEGLRVEAVAFPDGDSLDIGTPEDLERARRRLARR